MTEPTTPPSPIERTIAASVDAGLAGLLSSVLASSRVSVPPAVQPPAVQPQAVQPPADFEAPEQVAANPRALPDQTDSEIQLMEERIVVDSHRNRLRLRHAEEPLPTKPLRALNARQLAMLLEALSALRARPGEEGLPPGMLVLDIRNREGRLQGDSLYGIRSQVDASVRNGDIAAAIPDIGIVLFCGGLFFPGDLEVMGARVRRRALDRSPSVLINEELHLVMAGAMSFLNEDPITFLTRGVSALDESVALRRQDIVIDYGDQLLDKLT
jgi:hypothetical protein